eukprot:CAMPEP_0119349370 /NCGR_PEP_ID=MMETSP1333-20130426/109516_1 /TAXON_ID=418940 /ORGANISM="Scyphosphaera apsteinii, Strain RCC1455" /LENGTH=45 /DNA_ID= /DNA_START= /DNA_END= /DNA_ORIENTATION=
MKTYQDTSRVHAAAAKAATHAMTEVTHGNGDTGGVKGGGGADGGG